MAEAAFSEDGKYYSAISGDGRLKIWDTETNTLKQEYTPDLHLSAPPSCLQWLTVTQSSAQKQGKKRTSVSETESPCIALGTCNGNILIYSVTQAKIQLVLRKGNNKVTALDWHRRYGLYSCSARDNSAVEWDLSTGNVRNSYSVAVESKNKQGNHISAIKIVPHDLETKAHYLVTAAWQVHLWRLCKGDATIVKTLGHNASQTAVLAVASFENKCWLVEGSQNERLLSFWDVTISEDHQPLVNGDDTTPHKKKRKKSLTNVTTVTNATYNFVLEDAPRVVDVQIKEDGGMRVGLAAATRSGVVHYYGQTLDGASIKPIKPSVTVQVSTADANPMPLQCCRLRPTGEILLGYHNGPLMAFETVTPDLKTKTQVLIRGESKSPKKAKQVQNETNKVRSDARGRAAVGDPLAGAARKRLAPGAQIEVPMEARLANLSLDARERGASAVNQNLTKLLVQGLHSNDKSILELVLHRNDCQVASRTVAHLPAEYVPRLLDCLADMAAHNTTLCASVCTWVRALTQRHAALLLASLASRGDHLARLLAIFTHRRSHLCQLLNLKGRVELTVRQRSAARDAADDQPAVLQYNDDTSSEDEEMPVEKYKSESEASWDDDKFESEQENGDETGDDSDGSEEEADDDDDDDDE